MEQASHGAGGLFDVERRREAISAKGDPLETIKKIVQWEDFRADIEGVTETKPEERKRNACRRMDRSGGTFWQIGSEVPVPVFRAVAFTPERGPKGLRVVGVRYALKRPAPRPWYRRLKEWQSERLLLPRKHGQTPGPQA
jgi:hypothetical protein